MCVCVFVWGRPIPYTVQLSSQCLRLVHFMSLRSEPVEIMELTESIPFNVSFMN